MNRSLAPIFVLSLAVCAPTVVLAQPRCTEAELAPLEAHFDVFADAASALPTASTAESAALLATLVRERDAMSADRCGVPLDVEGGPPLERRSELLSWIARGGIEWMMQVLSNDGHSFSLPPTVARELTAAALPATDPMQSLLCPETSGSSACGASGELFRVRAESWLDLHDELEARQRASLSIADGGGAPSARCEAAARAVPPPEQYETYLSCRAAASEDSTLLPLGRFHAPDAGWLVVRGRRGHYAYCDEVHAFDLATGAHYEASHCSELIHAHGSTSHERSRAGRVPVDALRELALLLVVSPHVLVGVREREVEEPLPLGIVAGPVGALRHEGSGWRSSAQTELAWAWSRGASEARAEGTFLWPDSDDSRHAYADHLLSVLDATFVEGCAPTALPRALQLGAESASVSHVDADPDARQGVEDELAARLLAIRAPRCR